MKISKDHFETMRTAVLATIDRIPDCRERYMEAGLSNMRLNFDLWYASRVNGERPEAWVCRELYPLGVNDDHIGTALARIVGNDGTNRNGKRR